MTSTPRIHPAAVCLLALPALLLSACSGTAPSASGPAASAAPQPATGAAQPSVASAVPTGDDLCAVVDVKQAAAALATDPPIATQAAGTFLDGEPECGFASSDRTSVIVNVTLFDAKRDPFSMGSGVTTKKALTPVSGLGDQAGVNDTEANVAVRGHVLSVEAFSGTVSRDQLTALARAFAAKL